MLLNGYRSFLRSIGEPIRRVGCQLEVLGASVGSHPAPKHVTSYEKIVKLDSEGIEYDVIPALNDVGPIPSSFLAPSASLNGASLKPAEGSSVWYNAEVFKGGKVDSLALGAGSSIMDHAMVASDVSIGEQVVVGPHARVEAGVTLSSRCIIGAGAVLEQGVVVESDVIVAEGAFVKAKSKLVSGNLYAGVEAGITPVRELDAEEIEEIVSTAEATADFAKTHAEEWNKGELVRDVERIIKAARNEYTPTIIEDAGDEMPLVNTDANPIVHKTRRGLIYDK